jgi:RimJ/RimL family protein N-acetyltransferase
MKRGSILKTDRLILRHWKNNSADRDVFFRLNSDPEIMRFFPARKTRTEADALFDKIARVVEDHGFGLAAACLKDTGQAVGFTGVAPVDYFTAPFLPADEIGWRFIPEVWGQGLATEAAAALLDHAHTDLGIRRIVAFAVRTNEKSIAVMKRLGMHERPDLAFDHPLVPDTMPELKPHVLYEMAFPQ